MRFFKNGLKELLDDVRNGELSSEEAYLKLKDLPYAELDFAKVDHHRCLRTGFPEVVYCQGKSPKQLTSISEEMLKRSQTLLATRANAEAYEAIRLVAGDALYHDDARLVVVDRRQHKPTEGNVVVVSAGTSDLPIAAEAAVTAELMESNVNRIQDVGVAGIHRLFAFKEQLEAARVIVVVAGMDGVLPSVVGGLVDCPVIAVPTSIGYGASFGGLAALLTMLNSCATGVAVVNIDNGFGAGYLASLINRQRGRD